MKHGVDVASDHHLPGAKLELGRNLQETGQHQQYDATVLLKDTTKQQEFKIVLLNKFQVLEEETISEK